MDPKVQDDGDSAEWVPDEGEDELLHHRRELYEVQQLMQGFAEELSKLNEALEVMGAYVERMRRSAGSRTRRSFH